MRSIFSVFFLIVLVSCASVPVEKADNTGKIYQVYFLGGQSNMDGYGYSSEIAPEQRDLPENVLIFHGNQVEDGLESGSEGLWQVLGPGHGTGFTSTSQSVVLSDRFGPEFSFGRELSRLKPETNIAMIKYARGGTALVHGVSGYGSWDPDYSDGNGRNQYDYALATIENALAVEDIDGDGKPDELVPAGIIWMQGEADAYDDLAAAEDYAQNLARLMGLLRSTLGDEMLPVVVGQIKDSGATPETRKMTYLELVQAGQRAFAEEDRCAGLVSVTEEFQFLPDGWHYLSADYLTLGEAFAREIDQLEASCR